MSEITIIPLGTVSPYLKNDKNCPGFLIKYKNQNILLDCGNGITRLLQFPSDLENLTIMITHYHKDHFGDIGAIQYASYVYHKLGLLNEKVKVYLPKTDFGYSKKAIQSNRESYCDYYDIDQNGTLMIDDMRITFEDNHSHSIPSYMIKLENQDYKIVYTSDVGTTSFDALVEFCKDAQFLICESSFLKSHHITSSTHMTSYDAGFLAKHAKVEKLMISHFWPEEEKELYLKEAKQIFENTLVAEEGKAIVLRK